MQSLLLLSTLPKYLLISFGFILLSLFLILFLLFLTLGLLGWSIQKKGKKEKKMEEGREQWEGQGEEEEEEAMTQIMQWSESKWAPYIDPIDTFLSVPATCSILECLSVWNLKNIRSFSKMLWPWEVRGNVFGVFLIWHFPSAFSRLLQIWLVLRCCISPLILHLLYPFLNLSWLSFHHHPPHRHTSSLPAFTPPPPHLISQERWVAEKRGST